MKTLLLWLTAAFATAAQVYWLLAWGIWGAPTSPIQYVALCGSLVLLSAALLAPWRLRVAAATALCGTVAIWCFYAPALVITLTRLPYATLIFRPRLALQLLLALIPVALLVVSTFHAARVVRHSPARFSRD